MSVASSLARDSTANVARVVANALFAIAVTPFVLRALPRDEYSAWILVVGVAGYVGLAELGIQGAVIRRIAGDRSRGIPPEGVLCSALAVLLVAASVASVVVLAVGQEGSWLFAAVPLRWRHEALSSFRILGLSASIALPGSAMIGYFSAVHRAIVPSAINLVVKVGSGALIVFLVRRGSSLHVLAMVYGLSTVALTTVLWLIAGFDLGFRCLSPLRLKWTLVREMRDDAATFVWWSVALVAITGLDAIVVSRVDFAAVGAFGVAAQVTGLVLSTFSALVIPLLPMMSSVAAVSPNKLDGYLLRCSNIATGLLAVGVSSLFAGAPSLMRLYGGANYAKEATLYLRVLLIGTLVRQAPAVLGLSMVARGEHRRIRVAPLIEGGTNVVASISLAYAFGAVGVAWGTVIGGLSVLVGHAVVTLQRGGVITVTGQAWLSSCFRRPVVVLIPGAVGSLLAPQSGLLGLFESAVVALASAAIYWWYVLAEIDRHEGRHLLGRLALGRAANVDLGDPLRHAA